jgi:hypothetical protein
LDSEELGVYVCSPGASLPPGVSTSVNSDKGCLDAPVQLTAIMTAVGRESLSVIAVPVLAAYAMDHAQTSQVGPIFEICSASSEGYVCGQR